jgi:hypothetical protein
MTPKSTPDATLEYMDGCKIIHQTVLLDEIIDYYNKGFDFAAEGRKLQSYHYYFSPDHRRVMLELVTFPTKPDTP